MLTISAKSNNLKKAMFNSADKITRATAEALWDTAKQMKTEASEIIREELNLTKKRVDNNISLIFRERGTSVVAGILIREKPLVSLKRFKLKQEKLGVEFKPFKNYPAVLIRSAFGPKKKAGLWGGVYKRVSKKRKPLQSQLKENQISIAEVTRGNRIAQRVAKGAEEKFKNNMTRRINLIKLRAEGKAAGPRKFGRR